MNEIYFLSFQFTKLQILRVDSCVVDNEFLHEQRTVKHRHYINLLMFDGLGPAICFIEKRLQREKCSHKVPS